MAGKRHPSSITRLRNASAYLWRACRREPLHIVVRISSRRSLGRGASIRGRVRSLAFAAVSALLCAAPARAAFQGMVEHPRSAAMGGASLGAAPSSVFVHAASAAGLERPEAYFAYTRLYAGLAGVDTLDRGTLSASIPTRFGVLSTGLWRFRGASLKTEQVVGLGLAVRPYPGLSLGVLAKHLNHSYSPSGSDASDPVFSQGTSRSAISADLGVSMNVYGGLSLGLSVHNINEPDVGLRTEDRVEREVTAGMSWALPTMGLSLLGDLSFQAAGGRPATPRFGVEKRLHNDTLAFRAGIGPEEFAAGFGVNVGRLGFDYALVLRRNLMEGNMGTHSFGVRVGFGGK